MGGKLLPPGGKGPGCAECERECGPAGPCGESVTDAPDPNAPRAARRRRVLRGGTVRADRRRVSRGARADARGGRCDCCRRVAAGRTARTALGDRGRHDPSRSSRRPRRACHAGHESSGRRRTRRARTGSARTGRAGERAADGKCCAAGPGSAGRVPGSRADNEEVSSRPRPQEGRAKTAPEPVVAERRAAADEGETVDSADAPAPDQPAAR